MRKYIAMLTPLIWGLSILFVLLVSGICYVYVTVDPPGYCRAQQRYISDDEFLKASVALLNWDMNRTVLLYPQRIEKKRKDVSGVYKEIDFDSKNANCCSVGRTQPTFFERVWNGQKIFVRLNPKTSKGPVDRMGDGFFELEYSVCGRLVDSSLGIPDANHDDITTTNYFEIIQK